MGYRYLDHLTQADIAFEATAQSLEGLLAEAANATLAVMVSNLSLVRESEKRDLTLRSDSNDFEQSAEQLLHDFLEKLLFFKDAEQLLLKPKVIHVSKRLGPSSEILGYELHAQLHGETIDPSRHDLIVDVKAVTFHQYIVEHQGSNWRACVVLDV